MVKGKPDFQPMYDLEQKIDTLNSKLDELLLRLPNLSSRKVSGVKSISAGTEVNLVTVEGTGRMVFLNWWTDYYRMRIYIYCDGNVVFYDKPESLQNQGFDNSPFGIRVLKYDTANNDYRIIFMLPFEFKSKLEINAGNPDTVAHNSDAICIVSLVT